MPYSDFEKRVLLLANFILENNSTIRATAKIFNIPKSTVHHDLSTKLKFINPILFKQVKKLLINNFNIKHLHGGESTKLKYAKLKQNININDEIEALGID